MNDFEFIQEFKKMKSIKKICEELDVNYKMILLNKACEDDIHLVAQNCKAEIIKLTGSIIIGGNVNGEKTNTL